MDWFQADSIFDNSSGHEHASFKKLGILKKIGNFWKKLGIFEKNWAFWKKLGILKKMGN